jgi:hypothetical protein
LLPLIAAQQLSTARPPKVEAVQQEVHFGFRQAVSVQKEVQKGLKAMISA